MPAGGMSGRRQRPLPPRVASAQRSSDTGDANNDRRRSRLDIYHRLLTMPWPALFGALSTIFVAFNLIFAGLYLLQNGSIANARPHSLTDAFFFSVQTTATIGYGDMRPATLYANLLVTIEVLAGMTMLAVATGLVFARFSRPTARVMFSRAAVIARHDGVPTLMFRAANQRRNQILEAQASVMLLRDETTGEGVPMRRFHELLVVRPRTPVFVLTWTVMHPIDEASPLYGETRQSLIDRHAEIVVGIAGIDETFSQTIHARHSYRADEILWNRRFADILGHAGAGPRSIDYGRFHDTVEIDEALQVTKT